MKTVVEIQSESLMVTAIKENIKKGGKMNL